MLALAFAQIVWSIAFQWVTVTGGDNGILGVWPEKWAASPSHFYWLSIGVAALAVAALRIIVFSPFGYALRATRDSALRGEAIGIDGKKIQWTAFVIAGTVAGVGGALFAYLKGSVFPDSLGISLSVDALVMVLLGGVETVSGAVVGAIVYKAPSAGSASASDCSKLVLGGALCRGRSAIGAARSHRSPPSLPPGPGRGAGAWDRVPERGGFEQILGRRPCR